jgi:gluconate 5-dehydrogenase
LTQTCADLFDVRDKVAFIPGGYGGIGTAIARGLAARGARVAVAGRHPEHARTTAAALAQCGHPSIGFGFDARQPGEARDAVTRVVDELGGVDFLVNCVGTQVEEPLLDVTEAAASFVTGQVLFVDGGITASQ